MDNILFDYPLITHPCVSPDNNLIAVYNIAQLKPRLIKSEDKVDDALLKPQLVKLESVKFLKSVYHSYPDNLLDVPNPDTSLSSLVILGEVKNEIRLLCL